MTTPISIPCGPGPNYSQNVQIYETGDLNLIYDVCLALKKAPFMTKHYIATPYRNIIVVLSSTMSDPMPTYIHFNKFENV